MKKFLLISLLIIALLVPSIGNSTICFWKSCPQDTGAYKAALKAEPTVIPTFAILPNINLNGETDYIFRSEKDGGSGFGIGVSTTLMTIKGFIDIDGKFVQMVQGNDSQLGGIGTSVSLPDLMTVAGLKWPFGKFATFKVGGQVLFDIGSFNRLKPYFGLYAHIIEVRF